MLTKVEIPVPKKRNQDKHPPSRDVHNTGVKQNYIMAANSQKRKNTGMN